MTPHDQVFHERLAARHRLGRWFEVLCRVSTWSSLIVLAILLAGIVWQAWGWLDWQFLTSFDSRIPARAGIFAGFWGSLWVITLTTLLAVPIGVGAAVYLEEYAKPNLLTRLIQVNLSNLAGVPSIVYGILGLTVFVRMFGLFNGNRLVIEIWLGLGTLRIPIPFDRSVVSGALTMALLVLPVVIIAAQEALRSIPASIRHGSYALGATQWQTIRYQVLPAALPGIMTGVILSISRAIGETAPLLMIGALTFIPFTPGKINSVGDAVTHPQKLLDAPFDTFTTIPIQIYNWVSRPKAEYQYTAAAGILVLLAVLLILNGVAIYIRHRFQSRIRW